jgi:peptidoglycan/xylan/chitin deacetylase (PgdA/CDA1 family)
MATNTVLNLNFHGIGTPKDRDFGEGESEFWATQSTFEAVLDLAAAHKHAITISFDDGNTTDIDIALPALQTRGLKATFFIVPGWLGIPGFITAQDVKTLADSGMTIGNHGLHHHFWTELDHDALAHEINAGRTKLEQLTAAQITTLAIPYGRYDDTVLATLQSHHYAHVFTSDSGTADPHAWLQPREHLKARHAEGHLQRLLSAL